MILIWLEWSSMGHIEKVIYLTLHIILVATAMVIALNGYKENYKT